MWNHQNSGESLYWLGFWESSYLQKKYHLVSLTLFIPHPDLDPSWWSLVKNDPAFQFHSFLKGFCCSPNAASQMACSEKQLRPSAWYEVDRLWFGTQERSDPLAREAGFLVVKNWVSGRELLPLGACSSFTVRWAPTMCWALYQD